MLQELKHLHRNEGPVRDPAPTHIVRNGELLLSATEPAAAYRASPPVKRLHSQLRCALKRARIVRPRDVSFQLADLQHQLVAASTDLHSSHLPPWPLP